MKGRSSGGAFGMREEVCSGVKEGEEGFTFILRTTAPMRPGTSVIFLQIYSDLEAAACETRKMESAV